MADGQAPKNDRKWRPAIFATVAVCMVALLPWLWRDQRMAVPGEVSIDGRIRVTVDVADTEPLRAKGLSGRPPLMPEQGMYFVFPVPDRYGFWMKDMRFPIDILWIAGTELVDITSDVPAPSDPGAILTIYRPRVPVDRVLEVPAGFAKRHGLRLGMPVEARY